MKSGALIRKLRTDYHRDILKDVLRLVPKRKGEAWNNTDTSSDESMRNADFIARKMEEATGTKAGTSAIHVQRVGSAFEEATLSFIKAVFSHLSHLRPGRWEFGTGGNISRFDQYAHLLDVKKAIEASDALRMAFGDYIVTPDIVVFRHPEDDKAINKRGKLLDTKKDVAGNTSLRAANNKKPIMHASVSCKWTLRSDRAQNVRTEGLNLVRNRKGRTPHVVVIVGEPMPSRLAPLAYGTGDIDCVYHFALKELQEAAGKEHETLNSLINGRRLRDISDLPFDLAV